MRKLFLYSAQWYGTQGYVTLTEDHSAVKFYDEKGQEVEPPHRYELGVYRGKCRSNHVEISRLIEEDACS